MIRTLLVCQSIMGTSLAVSDVTFLVQNKLCDNFGNLPI